MQKETIIKTTELYKTYGSGEAAVRALKPCNIVIGAGEKIAVVGASGSGKSTLLHLLGGLDRPTGGVILFHGEDLYGKKDAALAKFRRQNVGFVFQSYNLVPELSAEENIRLPLLLDGKKPDKGYFDQVIQTLGLSDRLKHFPGELSGGQQQRAAIARAVMSKPSVLLCDEPTGNLDTKSGEEVMRLLHELSDNLGVTLVVVTHDENIAAQMERRISITDGTVGGGACEG